MYVARIPNRGSPPAILLRESYRQGGKVKNRTLANLSHWPEPKVDALAQTLKGLPPKLDLSQAFEITRSLPHGHVAAVLGTARRLGVELGRSVVREGDLLIVKIGSIGYSAILDDLNGHDRAVIPANLAKVSVDPKVVDIRYLYRWLTSTEMKRYLRDSASKTAQPALSLGKLRAVPVPLPPLDEQRRIAAILDQADELRAKRRRVLSHLDAIAQSIFLDMFGKFSGKFLTVEEVAAPEKGSIRTGPFGGQLLHGEFVDEGIAVLGLDKSRSAVRELLRFRACLR